MVVSQTCLSLFRPESAFSMRTVPSALNGRVTIPSVSARICSLAMPATSCAEPVPVPPPMPAVTKTMLAPFRKSRISLSFSRADSSPTSGLAPAPRPLVLDFPIRIFFGARMVSRCLASVLMAQSCAPLMPASTQRLMVLQPPPPHPMILIQTSSWAAIRSSSSSVALTAGAGAGCAAGCTGAAC